MSSAIKSFIIMQGSETRYQNVLKL